MCDMLEIILASGSPRRRQLLTLAGIPHRVLVSDVDETISGAPDFQVRELALRKANAAASILFESCGNRNNTAHTIILAADTVVCINGKILNKPATHAEAFDMLSALQGTHHTVFTGVAILQYHGTTTPVAEKSFVSQAKVYFRPLTQAEINAYIATGEPFDKAGAYGIQEKGAMLVERVDGDFYTVVGLPITKVCTALAEIGVDVWHMRSKTHCDEVFGIGESEAIHASSNMRHHNARPANAMCGTEASDAEMIIGTGVDIIKIDRFKKLAASSGADSNQDVHQNANQTNADSSADSGSTSFMRRVFTLQEQAYLKGKPAQSMAGLFAAKEAVSKAFGTGFTNFSPCDIEIKHDNLGKPYATLHNHAKTQVEKITNKATIKIHISITHSETDAMAFALVSC